MLLTAKDKYVMNGDTVPKRPTVEIPRFIELKGCINCKTSKSHKERHGTDYGFDHELIAGCLISGCMDYGYSLGRPFLDPDEAIRLARVKYPERITKAEKYARDIKQRFSQFYRQ